MKKLFPNLQEESDMIQKQYLLLNERVTFEELIDNIRILQEEGEMPSIWYEVYEYFKQETQWQQKLQNALEALTYTNIPHNLTKENVEHLYGNTMQTSVSKLEQ